MKSKVTTNQIEEYIKTIIEESKKTDTKHWDVLQSTFTVMSKEDKDKLIKKTIKKLNE